jgi:hypothetical protein
MANLFTNAMGKIGQAIGNWLMPYMGAAPTTNEMPPENLDYRYATLRNYYNGDHRAQLKDKEGKGTSDNITVNLVGLAVDRSVSRLYRGGVTWKLPEGRTKQQEYLDKVWELNKQPILLTQVGLHGAVYGTPYFKTSPEGITDPFDGEKYPRLIPLDPEITRIKTDPQDMGKVALYQIRYKIGNKAHYEITRRSDVAYDFDKNTGEAVVIPADETVVPGTWFVEEWETLEGNRLTQISKTEWEYDFPPILHWKNLPSLRSCYGDSDIDDAISAQDKYNFAVSNEGKIIKFYAHPQTIGTGFAVKDMQALEGAVGAFHSIPSAEAKVYNLEMQSDLASTRNHATALKQAVSDITREPDASSLTDKAGALTNFAVQVLFDDATGKNVTKRQLYGDAFKEQNRRLLVLAKYEGEESDPGDIQWGEALPINITEEMAADEKAMNMGIIDKETVAGRYLSRYGKSWDDIKAALKDQQDEANQENADIGSQILRNFSQGKGAEQMPNKQPQDMAGVAKQMMRKNAR